MRLVVKENNSIYGPPPGMYEIATINGGQPCIYYKNGFIDNVTIVTGMESDGCGVDTRIVEIIPPYPLSDFKTREECYEFGDGMWHEDCFVTKEGMH